MVAVGRYGTVVQVVGVPLSGALLAGSPDFEVDFECLDQLHIARLADYQRPSVPAPAVAAAAMLLYQLVN